MGLKATTLGTVAIAAAIALTAALGSAVGSGDDAAGGAPGHVYSSQRYDFSAAVPPGWHRSHSRLVDTLLMPREVVSLGTFGMAVGGGGNCGREPAAAIRRMRPGDSLVTVQEYSVNAKMRRQSRMRLPSVPRIGRLQRSAGVLARGSGSPPSGAPLYSATIPFWTDGRAFDALVYFRGRPDAELRATVDSILAGLRFGPHPEGLGRHA